MSAPVPPAAMDRRAVEAVLPHREPFLFVDAVTDAGEDWIETRWRVPEDADFFRGHYPDEPVLPGVILSEHVFQTGALLAARLLGPGDGRESAEEGIPVLTRIEGARFRRIVRPGEELATRVRLEERAGPAFRMSGEVRCGAARVLRLSLIHISEPTRPY